MSRSSELDKLLRSITNVRFRPYLEQARKTDAALALYEQNVLLSARFLVCAHFLEIALRNEIHELLSAPLGKDWMLAERALLHPQTRHLANAARQLQAKEKVVNGDNLVSELPLGFWVGMLSPGYEKGQQYWRRYLHKGFAFRPAGHDRKKLHQHYDQLRDFRNRVAHHERILHHQPLRMIDKCLQATGWINPAMRDWAQQLLERMP